jgi:hypothetical protein
MQEVDISNWTGVYYARAKIICRQEEEKNRTYQFRYSDSQE